jgi:hypothetical protein
MAHVVTFALRKGSDIIQVTDLSIKTLRHGKQSLSSNT